MTPAGLEPATVCLAYHFGFRRPFGSWSGLSLHLRHYSVRRSAYSLCIVFSYNSRLAPQTEKLSLISRNPMESFLTMAPIEGRCSFHLSYGAIKKITSSRRGRDSNPRHPFEYFCFQDRHNRPLCHLSLWGKLKKKNTASQIELTYFFKKVCSAIFDLYHHVKEPPKAEDPDTYRIRVFCLTVSCSYTKSNVIPGSHPHLEDDLLLEYDHDIFMFQV